MTATTAQQYRDADRLLAAQNAETLRAWIEAERERLGIAEREARRDAAAAWVRQAAGR